MAAPGHAHCARAALSALLLAAAALLVTARPAHAQSLAPALLQRYGLAAPSLPPLLFAYDWPAHSADRPGPPGIPVFARIGEFLRTTRVENNPPGGSAAPGAPASAGVEGAVLGGWRTISLAEQRPELQDGDTGQSSVMRFITYRLPWLLTPESAIHALPTISLGGAAARFDVMAGAMGGRSGAYGEFTVHF